MKQSEKAENYEARSENASYPSSTRFRPGGNRLRLGCWRLLGILRHERRHRLAASVSCARRRMGFPSRLGSCLFLHLRPMVLLGDSSVFLLPNLARVRRMNALLYRLRPKILRFLRQVRAVIWRALVKCTEDRWRAAGGVLRLLRLLFMRCFGATSSSSPSGPPSWTQTRRRKRSLAL